MRKTLFSATIPETVANTMFAQLPPSAAWTPHNKGQQSNGYGKKLSPAITANAKYPYPVTAMPEIISVTITIEFKDIAHVVAWTYSGIRISAVLLL